MSAKREMYKEAGKVVKNSGADCMVEDGAEPIGSARNLRIVARGYGAGCRRVSAPQGHPGFIMGDLYSLCPSAQPRTPAKGSDLIHWDGGHLWTIAIVNNHSVRLDFGGGMGSKIAGIGAETPAYRLPITTPSPKTRPQTTPPAPTPVGLGMVWGLYRLCAECDGPSDRY